MADVGQPFRQYLRNLERELAAGRASEPSHYPALKTLLESLEPQLLATSEPTRIACGAPDFIVSRRQSTVGYVEAKDIGLSLDEAERTDQLRRYWGSLPNLILTDFLEFRWYTEGQERGRSRLGRPEAQGRIRLDRQGVTAVSAMLGDFLAYQAPSPNNPRELAQRLARLCRLTKDTIVEALKQESETGTLHSQLAAFRDVLIPDLTGEQFADMYAQTIAYGLFAARTMTDTADKSVRPTAFTRQSAAYLLPRTNPFLRQLFADIAGPNLDNRIAWLVDDLAQLLAGADMAGILADFGKRTRQEDPVVHFYETFLKEYDPKVREMRGVYYTPEPVVSYIVRSVDWLLRSRFGRPDGLADPNTLILDPAAGTGTFLYMAIDLIHQWLVGQGQGGAWNDYVARYLLPRIFGFELLMAPYAVAHLKLGLQLRDLGYQFGSGERLGVYLTNTLEEALARSQVFWGQFIADEANAAAEIKREKPIEVVIGNPPYSVSSLNRGPWIQRLIEDYKRDIREKKLNLDDDYVKFLRFGQWRIEQTGQGILAMITNHAYLDNVTFRQMRRSLMDTFSDIYVINLHGNTRKREVAPSGGKDENVFDIQQGVAIAVFVKEPGKSAPARVHHADLWGLREAKYQALVATDLETTEWTELAPKAPYYFFVPQEEELAEEYQSGWKVTDIFQVHGSGVKTDRDDLCFDFDKAALATRMERLFSGRYDEDFRRRYRIEPSSSYDVETRAKNGSYSGASIRRCLYRPFDQRWLYYQPGFTSRPAYDVMRHMLQENLALIATRQFGGHRHFITLCANGLTEISSQAYAPYTLFPLYLYDEPGEGELALGSGRRPNLNPRFVAELCAKMGLPLPDWYLHPVGQTFLSGPDLLSAQAPPQQQQTDHSVGQTFLSVQGPDQPTGMSAPPPPSSALPSPMSAPPPAVPPTTSNPVGQTGMSAHPLELHIYHRRLPHWTREGSTYFVTFRLAGGELTPEERALVLDHIKEADPQFYRLLAAVVMPDHVHLLLTPNSGIALSRIMKGIKGVSARLLNQRRGTRGRLWQDESFDRIVRDETELQEKLEYMWNNPVKKGLVDNPGDYESGYFMAEADERREDKQGQTGMPAPPYQIAPEDIFHYAYAVFHSPTYRSRYAEFLKTDFPRLPLTSDRRLFQSLADKGADLVSLHLMESPALDIDGPRFDLTGNNLVDQVRYDPTQQRVYVNKQQYFAGVEAEVWGFHVGGYQVCQKWLKDRQGRGMSYEDVRHYQRVVVALRQTIRLMAEIDGLIPAWPIE